MIHLGINPIGWSNDDMPELGGETPLEVCLREAREAGFEGVEKGHKFPSDPSALRAILARHGLRFVSGWYSGRLIGRSAADEIEAIGAHLDLLAKNEAKVLIFAETTGCIHGQRGTRLSRRPTMREDDWPGFCARLTEVAKHCLDRGLRLVVHHHMGTVIETAEDIDRLMDGTGDSVGLLLDAGHATFADADPAALAGTYASRIFHVHFKDVRRDVLSRAKAADWSFLDAVLAGIFTVPGDGFIDFAAMLTPLKAAGYAGWMVVEAEQDPDRADPFTYATLGQKNLASLVEDAGFRIAAPLDVPA